MKPFFKGYQRTEALNLFLLPRVLQSSLIINSVICKGTERLLAAEGVSTFRQVWKSYSWCWFFLFVSRGYDSLKGTEQLYILSWTHISTKPSLWGFTLCRGCKSTKIFTDIIVIITNIFSSITKKSQYTLFLVLACGHVSIFWELRQSHFHLVKIDSICDQKVVSG